MIAKNLIAKNIKAVNINADIKDILEEMERHHIYHLPLVEKNKVIGIISEEKIKDLNLHREDLPKYIEEVRPVNEKEYFFQIWSQMISNQLSCIPVIDDNENYIGSITQEELVNYYTSSFNYTEPGSIIILSTKKQKYSLAKIAQIVEEEHCVILSSFLTEKFNEEDVLITIKVNCMDIESILNSFYRFEIDVEVVFTDKEYSDIMKERYHGLMNYLNV
ncbi:MAG: CBS domain-containing protein [Saprospiraceae bacterium]|jgi:predicted transcriptional regulator|nr:CBS domain-containing protein [Saprospiraceae bacterium]